VAWRLGSLDFKLVLASIELLRAKLAPSPPIRFQGKAALEIETPQLCLDWPTVAPIDVEKSYGQKAAL
jgi:hypothetical protein